MNFLALPSRRWAPAALVVAMCAVAAFAAAAELPARGLCAHRGGGAAYPENTVIALQEAVRLGVQMVEFDLALTRDDELVLMHDATVDRTTNGKGKVLDLTLAEIRQLDAGAKKAPRFAGTRVPTFAEVLAVLPRNVWVNIDFKADARFGGRSTEIARRVANILKAEGRLAQSLFAARPADAAAARAVVPEILICSMDRKPDPADYVQAAIAQRTAFIQLRDCARDPRLPAWIAALKGAGVRINYFYTNDPAEAARLLAAGVDFVLADDVPGVLPRLPGIAPVQPIWK